MRVSLATTPRRGARCRSIPRSRSPSSSIVARRGGDRLGVAPHITAAPPMSDPHEAELAARPRHDQRLFERVEHAKTLGIERVRADEILAGQKRHGGELELESEAIGGNWPWDDAVHVG